MLSIKYGLKYQAISADFQLTRKKTKWQLAKQLSKLGDFSMNSNLWLLSAQLSKPLSTANCCFSGLFSKELEQMPTLKYTLTSSSCRSWSRTAVKSLTRSQQCVLFMAAQGCLIPWALPGLTSQHKCRNKQSIAGLAQNQKVNKVVIKYVGACFWVIPSCSSTPEYLRACSWLWSRDRCVEESNPSWLCKASPTHLPL